MLRLIIKQNILPTLLQANEILQERGMCVVVGIEISSLCSQTISG